MQRVKRAAPAMPEAPAVPEAREESSGLTLDELVRHAAPAAQKVLRALIAAQAHHQLFQPAQAVIVAVSGGADSGCLLHALHQLAPHWHLALHVAHVDHALRPDSAGDAAFVAALAQQFSLPLHQTRLTPGILDDDPRGLEAAARSARYAFLRQIASQVDGNAATPGGTATISTASIATAHHQDDQAETLLLHLIQGSGLHGLAGMAWVGEVPDEQQPTIRLVRPLLGVSRADIHAYLRAYGLAWREDSSNHNLTHLRNQLRHQVLPQLATMNPNIHATLARTADLLAAEAEHADQRDRAMLAALTHEHTPSTRIVLNWFRLTQADQATQRGVLRQAMLALGIDLRTVGLAGIDALLNLAHVAAASGPHPLVSGWMWTLLHRKSGLSTGISLPVPTDQDASLRSRSGAKHGVCDEESPWFAQTERGIPPFGRNDSALLSLHRTNFLPLTVDHPHFAAPLEQPLPIPQQGARAYDDWQLHSALLAPNDLPADWRSRALPWRLFADAQACGDLYLTTFQAGMTITPLGMDGHQRALGDIFTDRKVPPYLRAGWPVVVKENSVVVWVCGLVVAESVRVQPETRQVRYLHWQLEMMRP